MGVVIVSYKQCIRNLYKNQIFNNIQDPVCVDKSFLKTFQFLYCFLRFLYLFLFFSSSNSSSKVLLYIFHIFYKSFYLFFSWVFIFFIFRTEIVPPRTNKKEKKTVHTVGKSKKHIIKPIYYEKLLTESYFNFKTNVLYSHDDVNVCMVFFPSIFAFKIYSFIFTSSIVFACFCCCCC